MTLQRRLTVWTLVIVAAIFMGVMTVVYFVAEHQILEAEKRDSQAAVDHVAALVDARLNAVASTINGVELSVLDEFWNNNVDSLAVLVQDIVYSNRDIVGSSIAMAPYAKWNHQEHYMLYAFRGRHGDILSKRMDDDSDYDYLQMEWYEKPMESVRPHWSEPYFDRGGADMLMCTYSTPIRINGNPVAVLTGDIDLDGIAHIAKSSGIEEGPGICYMLSADQKVLYHEKDSMQFSSMSAAPGPDDLLFTAKVPATGWTLNKVVSKRELLRPMHRTVNYMIIMCMLTLVVLYFALRYVIHSLSRPEMKRQERLNTELLIAKRIQDGMLPDKGRIEGVTDSVDMASLISAAKEIAGDFYNYRVVGNHLHFIIGDVSGKGIPASIYMSIATEIYASLTFEDLSPADTVQRMNDMMARDNSTAMFTTALVGRLNLKTGSCHLCSAGHNPPLLIAAGHAPEFVILDNNIPIGVVDGYKFVGHSFKMPANSHLLLYTDGVTEAENIHKQQFGEQRLLDTVKDGATMSASELVGRLKAELKKFTRTQEQNDDITLLDVHYTATATSLRIKAIDDELPTLSRFCVKEGISDKARLAIEEAVVNIISYSGASYVDIDIRQTDRVEVTITDDGNPFDPTTYESKPLADIPQIGGQGINLIKKISEQVQYTRSEDKNILILSIQN